MPGLKERIEAILAHLEEGAHSFERAQYHLQMLLTELPEPENPSAGQGEANAP
jgi:hypothetical protein